MVEKLGTILSSGERFDLHVRADGAIRRLDCHIFDDVSVKTVVLALIPGGSECERSLLKVLLSLLTCVESYAGLSAVKVSDNLRLITSHICLVSYHPLYVVSRYDTE